MTVRHFYPAFRVFIFGVEVTDDVLSITVNSHDGRSPNTAEIELVNAGASTAHEQTYGDNAVRIAAEGTERYIVTHEDIAAMHATTLNLDDLWSDDERARLADVYAPTRTSTDALLPSVVSTISALHALDEWAEVASTVSERTRQRTASLLSDLRANLNRVIVDPIKRRILQTKVGAVSDVGTFGYQGLKRDGTATIFDALKIIGQATRYPLQVGDCVFHSSDPIRIFVRAPEPDGSQPWYYLFTGFVSDWTDSVNENNERVVRIRAEDPTRILRYARTTASPGLIDIKSQRQRGDDVAFTFFQNSLVDMTLPEFLFEVVFGNADPLADQDSTLQRTSTSTRIGVNSDTTINVPVASDGVGAFKLSGSELLLLDVGEAGPPTTQLDIPDASIGPLSLAERLVRDVELRHRRIEARTRGVGSPGEYHRLVADHRVTVSDLLDLAAEDLDTAQIESQFFAELFTPSAIDIDEVVTYIGEHPELYPVDGGRLFVLAPSSIGMADRQVLLKTLISPAMETSWSTRLKMIYDLCERIEFSFYATPKGDLVCEMPLFTFDPDDFMTAEHAHKPDRYEDEWVVRDDDAISWEHSFADEHIRTQMTCNPVVFKSQPYGLDFTFQDTGQAAVVVQLESLFPAFGVRQEKCDPRGLVEDREGAEAYAALMLSKWNSDARSARITAIPNIKIAVPNRPLKFAPRDFVCTVRKVTHTMRWGSDMETTYDVNYIRGWSGQRDAAGQKVYEPIGGLASQALNYALMFKQRGQSVQNTMPDPDVGDTSI